MFALANTDSGDGRSSSHYVLCCVVTWPVSVLSLTCADCLKIRIIMRDLFDLRGNKATS